jgi:hypothetical protein
VETPLGALARGAIAGAVGTAVMTALMVAEGKLKERLSNQPAPDPADGPAEVAERTVEGVLQRELPERHRDIAAQTVHWTYGTAWGGLYGLVQGTVRLPVVLGGASFGTFVWLASHAALLPAAKLEPPLHQQCPSEVGPMIANHLAYGVAVAATYRLLGRSER